MNNEELREKLADLCHRKWSTWMEYLYSFVVLDKDYGAYLPGCCNLKWRSQMNTEYKNLLEKEKESDRKIADEILEIIEGEK